MFRSVYGSGLLLHERIDVLRQLCVASCAGRNSATHASMPRFCRRSSTGCGSPARPRAGPCRPQVLAEACIEHTRGRVPACHLLIEACDTPATYPVGTMSLETPVLPDQSLALMPRSHPDPRRTPQTHSDHVGGQVWSNAASQTARSPGWCAPRAEALASRVVQAGVSLDQLSQLQLQPHGTRLGTS
jgi:hypothetical protein